MTSLVGQFTIARTWELTPKLITTFASGVDDPNECYMDDARPGGLVGHPGLAFTFQWNTRHMPGLVQDPAEARLAVHASVDLRFARPFRQGDVITAQGQTIAVSDIPPGTLSVQRVTMRDARGVTVATMDTAGIVRGVHTRQPREEIFAPVPLPEPIQSLGGEDIWRADVPISRQAAHIYSACADIWNPIHTERSIALAAGLPDIILHGSATMSIALREVINRSFGGDPTRLTRFAGQFRAMVIPGDTIVVRCIEERREAGEQLTFFEVLNRAGERAISHGVVVAQ